MNLGENSHENSQNSVNFHANSAKNSQIQSKNSSENSQNSHENSRPHLSIAFATRRFSRQTTLKKDIVEKIIIIKDINLRAPSLAQLLNLEKLHREFASTLKYAKSQPIALDEFYARVIEIFSVSALNSEFYAEIVRIFNALWHECKFPPNTSESDKRAFCLRLICRLLFCKFLQKKGLIDERLWDTNLAQDYYYELLEPLFFATLNTSQNERDYLRYGFLGENSHENSQNFVNLNQNSHENSQIQSQNSPKLQALLNAIPYLNGGLFAVQKNDFFSPQNPVQNRGILCVPNALVAGFFELLNKYHFSIDEGSVNVQIVGLNPELLGLVFENLLAKLSSEQDEAALAKSLQSDIADFEKSQKSEKNPKNSQRKATGSYYTPREIVSFMVRESLFAYLCRATKIHAQKLREFIFSDEAAHFESAETSAILSALKSLKILDPACGSGAFPMGILNEILALQERLGDTRTPHARKLEVLQSCIYGTDIQPMATEIARLRCFLSLIIDENPHDIKPLPNLEFKFICANSLLPLPVSASLHYYGYERDIERLNELRNEYFSAQDKSDIQKQYLHLRADITRKDLQVNMSDESLKNPLLAYDPFDSQSVAGFFDSEFMFGVSGFDIVIGNPPYIRQEKIPQKAAILAAFKPSGFANSVADIYTYFFAKGLEVLRAGGVLSFITSNKFTRAGYGANLRALLLRHEITHFIDLNGVKVFDNATVDTAITSVRKVAANSVNSLPNSAKNSQKSVNSRQNSQENSQNSAANSLNSNLTAATPAQNPISYLPLNSFADFTKASHIADFLPRASAVPQASLRADAFIFAASDTLALKAKIEAIGTPLKEWDIAINYGIKTGYNDAFIIDSATKDKILAACDDTVKSPLPCGGGLGVGKTERERTAALIKPILRGRDIKRYAYEWAGLWIIGTFPALRLDIAHYPALKNYLEKFMPRIAQSGEKGCRKKTANAWFETQDNIAYHGDFEKEKIVWTDMAKKSSFLWDDGKMFLNNTCYFITNANKYILAILNSNLMSFYLQQIASGLGDGAFRWFKQYVEKLPIPKITPQNQAIAEKIVHLVEQILESKKSPSLAEGDLGGGLSNKNAKTTENSQTDTSELESQIDHLTYALYALTPTEITLTERK